MKRAWIWLCVLLLAVPLSAQTKKIGILPFDDAAGVGPELGRQVAMFIRSELLKSKKLMPKFITYAPEEGEEGETPGLLDVEKAIALGRDNEVDLVLIGTILEAEAESERRGAAAADPEIASRADLLELRYRELGKARQYVEALYARWAELEAKRET